MATDIAGAADTESVENVMGFLEETFSNVTVHKIMTAAVLAVICLVIIKIMMILTDRTLRRAKMEEPVKKLLRNILRGALIFIAVILVMSCLEIPVTSLVAVFSVAGLALSLALQNFLSNVAGGFQILASQPFKLGDWVDAGGSSGSVVEIGMFYTKLHSVDNKLIQLPNSTIVSSTITNYTCEDRRQVEIRVKVDYNSDLQLVRDTLASLITVHPLTLTDPPPLIHVFSYGENSIEFLVRVWCANADYWTIYFDLMDNLKPTLDRVGIHMTYPHINVHMVEP